MLNSNKKINVAIVGATGAVGRELLALLAKRKWPLGQLSLLASKRSVGKKVRFNDKEITISELEQASFKAVDLAFFCAGSEVSLEYAPQAKSANALVIDNSSAFRLDKDVPLVVPECNAAAISNHNGIIANPNCSTIQMLVALKPLHDYAGLTKVRVATYQAVSGAGDKAIAEFESQIKSYAENKPPTYQQFPAPILGNAIPQVDVFLADDYTKEEFKMAAETKKILNLPDLTLSATCVRIGVMRSHSEAIWASFNQPIDCNKALELWSAAPGLKIKNRSQAGGYPLASEVANENDVYVGRLREDPTSKNGLCFWCAADQLLKGAALNAVQIAEAAFFKPSPAI